MTVLYSNDFEGLTHLQTLPAFTSAGGGNFIVLGPTFAPAPAARGSFRYGAPDNGDQAYWNGNTSLTSVAVRHATKVLSGAGIAHLLRYNTGNGACYRVYYEWDGTNLRGTIAKWDGGSTVGTQQSAYSVACSSSDVLHMESRAVGSTIELRLWTNSNARPASPLVTMTDSSYTTGAVGIRRVFGNTTYANVDDLVITDSAGGEDFFYSAATGPTITTHPANQTVTAPATATFTVAATASGGSLTYQWQRNGTNISGATSASYTTPATSVTGGSANNGDTYRCVVTDSNGSTTSNSATLTVNAAADTTPPTLSSPTGTKTGSTTASGSVSTNEANGTLYRFASTNATETVATVKAANLTQTVSSTGVQNVTFTGLTPNTTYYAHYVHRDAAGNDSTRVSSASFTTDNVTVPSFAIGPFGNRFGTAWANETISVDVWNASTKAFVTTITGVVLNSSGAGTVSSNSLVAGTTYLFDPVLSAGQGRRLLTGTAA